MSQILIYATKITPRLSYVANYVLQASAGCTVVLTNEKAKFLTAAGIKLQYGEKKIFPDGFFLSAHTLLFEKEVHPFDVPVARFFDSTALFPTAHPEADFPFDIFAAAFYLLTRYEEYLPGSRDVHGRFAGKASLAHQYGFLELPIIQMWTAHFLSALQKKYPEAEKPALSRFKFTPTYDIDIAWAYRRKGLVRTIGGLLKDLKNAQMSEVIHRLRVLNGQAADPFAVYDHLENMHAKTDLPAVYFFLLANRGKYDKNISPQDRELIRLVQKIHQKNPVGIHPSYAAAEMPAKLPQEINRLQKITGGEVRKSRQHYLKLTFPDTYQNLLQCGIKEDYTMGYADLPGFRAGTALPFLWFDLSVNAVTDLTVFPFQVMDVTLKNYLQLSPLEAFAKIKYLWEQTRAVGGHFITLWHNSSFAPQHGWTTEWQEVYTEVLRLGEG